MTTRNFQFLPNGVFVLSPNEVENGDGFYVSFNDYDTDIYGDVTTALVLGQMQHFYILNGDHRKAYSVLIPQGFDACMEYFRQHLDQMNQRYSEKPPKASISLANRIVPESYGLNSKRE